MDSKGRVFVPSRWRQELGEEVVVAKGLDHCLYLVAKPQFAGLVERLGQLSINRRADREYTRLLASSASEEQIDRQGRITIPPTLREWARLGREVVLAGAFERAEIWDRSSWETYRTNAEEQYEAIAEQLER